MLDTPCSEVVWRVLATRPIRQFTHHFLSRASPCAITFQLDSTSAACNNILKRPRRETLNWRPPHWFKWTRPFRRKTKSVFCACAITFQLASTFDLFVRNRIRSWGRAKHSGTSYLQFWHSGCEGEQSGTLATEAKCHMRSYWIELCAYIQALSALILGIFSNYQLN